MAIRVELELDTGDFERGIVRATTSLNQLQANAGGTITGLSRLSSESKNFLGTLRDVTVILGQAGNAMENLHRISTGWVGETVKLNAEVERMSALLKAMSTAADPVKEAADYIKNLREEAKQAPFSLQAMHQAFIRMKSGGLDPAAGSMKSLVDAVAAFGGTDETLGRASLAFQEMAGKGVVQMKELRNQLGMAVPQAMSLMARSFGVTYQQLMEDVHTGTVDAKNAIHMLNLEFERVYGGAAQRQMETFNGQLARMKVIAMDLAIKAGGADDNENGFFGTLKKQFREFNDMLSGSLGQEMAGKVGEGMTQVVLYIRRAIDAAIEFRGTIVSVGEAMAVGFGAQMAVAGLMSLTGVVRTTITELRLLTIQWQLAGQAATIGPILGAVGATLGTVAPLLPVVAGGLMLAADAFGFFGSKAKDAWEEMEKFGAHSLDQIKDGEKYVKELEDLRKRAFQPILVSDNEFKSGLEEIDRDIEQKKAKLDKLREDATREEARRGVSKGMDEVNDAVAAQRRVYNDQANFAAKHFEEQVKKVNEAGKSTLNLQKQYQQDVKDAAVQSYDAQINVLEQFIEKREEMARKGGDVEKAISEQMIEELRKRVAEQKKLQQQEIDAQMGSGKNKKGLNDDKLYEKGEKYLNKLNAELEGFRAGLAGLDPEVAELAQQLQDMKFGDPGIERVRDMIEQMLELKRATDDAHQAFRSMQNFETDALTELTKQRERIIALNLEEGQTLDTLDKLIIKYNQGAYKGFGPGALQETKKFSELKDAVTQVGSEATSLGDILKNTTFGQASTNAASGYLDTVNKIADTFSRIKGTNLGEALNGLQSNATTPAFAGPQGNYYSTLYGAESSNNPNAKAETSTAMGLGQFTEGTWREFMQAMHRDMLQLGDKAVLALRADKGLMEQATAWYAQKNAASLSANGVKPNDATVYAAHFLGPGGASTLLTKEDSVALRSIPELAAALKSNPHLQNMTVGSFKDMIYSKFGSGSTYLNSPSAAPMAQPGHVDIPQNIPSNRGQEFVNEAARLRAIADAGESAKSISEAMKKMRREIESSSLMEEGSNKHLGATMKDIRAGKYANPSLPDDASQKDPEAQRYKELIRLAKEWDEADKKALESKKLRTSGESAQDALTKKLQGEREAYQVAWDNFMKDPQDVKFSEAIIRLRKSTAEKLDRMKEAGGYDINSETAKAREAETTSLNAEVLKQIGATKLKEQEIRRSLMSENDARQDNFNKEMQRIDFLVDAYNDTEERKSKVVEQAEKYKAALRAQFAAQSPLGRQMKEWSDVTNNFERQVGGTIQTVSDSFAGAMVGMKTNWQTTLQTMSRDFMTLFLHSIVGTIGKGVMGQTGGLGGIFNSLFSGGAGGPMDLVGAVKAHTGGIVGAIGGYSQVPAAMFAGARRYHTGGMVGSDEVPIIARKGEGVFTQQQMAALGGVGGNKVNVAMPITVNANGGTSEQNRDLADQVGRQVEKIARGLVVDEVMKQMRPGNALYSRYGR